MIDIRAHRQKVTVNEPDAKAILPKPRSVQKGNSYQFYPDWKYRYGLKEILNEIHAAVQS